MQSVRLFAGLDSDALQAVLGCAQLLDVPAGTDLAREGGDEHEFYVLLQGELVVMQALGQGLAPLEVGSVRPGSSFGELGALLGERRTASVAASRASARRIASGARKPKAPGLPMLSLMISRPDFSSSSARRASGPRIS